jgi:hypothetical protein
LFFLLCGRQDFVDTLKRHATRTVENKDGICTFAVDEELMAADLASLDVADGDGLSSGSDSEGAPSAAAKPKQKVTFLRSQCGMAESNLMLIYSRSGVGSGPSRLDSTKL